jgi:thioredoxin 1
MMIEVTSDNFREEVVSSDVPVLLDYWAPWCAPCKMMTPVLEEMSEQYGEQIKFCKVNIDEVPMSDIPEEFRVQAVPTLILVTDGKVANKEVGLKTKDAIKALVGEAL